MADIKRFGYFNHFRADSSRYIIRYRKGRPVASGRGLSFWFQPLHTSLVEIEDHLQYARRYYNGAVRNNNNLVESFPSNLVAGLFGFPHARFFEIEFASQRNSPDVGF